MFIQTERTPNPHSLKFTPGMMLLETPMDFPNRETAKISPLALRLFEIEGIDGILIGQDFITVTKQEDLDWYVLKPPLLGAMMEHLLAQKPILADASALSEESLSDSEEDHPEIVKEIKALIDSKVRPAVAMDGGDIVFSKFENGVVYLQMKGACSGCPSSSATLKSGIENMLRHYIPEVTEVRAV